MKILLVAPYSSLPTDIFVNRFAFLARTFAERGHDITFVTSDFSHHEKIHRAPNQSEIHKNLKVIMLHEPGYQSHVSLKRVVSIRAFRKNFETNFGNFDEYDVVYSSYPPIGHNIYLSESINRSKTSFVVDVQDVWPESFSSVVPMIKKVSPQWLPFSRSANKVYSSASALVAVSQTYLERAVMVNRCVPSLTAYLGSEFEMVDHDPSKDGPTKLAYIGTLSYSYDIDTVIRAVHELSTAGCDIEFNIFGDGPDAERLKSLPHIGTNFHGMIAYKSLEAKLREQHIAVNAIKSHAPQSITNKLCDYFLLGCPILNTQNDAEIVQLASNVLHRNYQAGNVRSAIDAIVSLTNDRNLHRTWKCNPTFSRHGIAQKIISFVEDLRSDR